MAIPIGKLSIGAFLLLVISSLLVSQCQAKAVKEEVIETWLRQCVKEGQKAAKNVSTLDISCSNLQSSQLDNMTITVPELAFRCKSYFELGCNQVRELAACASGVSIALTDFPRNVNFSCDKVTGLDNEVLFNFSCCMVCTEAIKESRAGNPCVLGEDPWNLHTSVRAKCCQTASDFDRKVALGLPIGNSAEDSLSKVLNVNDAAINSSLSHRLNHTDPLVTSTLTSTTSTTPPTSTTTTTTTTTTTSTPSSLNVNDSTSETPTTLITTPTETTTITPTTSSPESEKVTAGNEVENEESSSNDSESNIIPHATVNRNGNTRDSNGAKAEPTLDTETPTTTGTTPIPNCGPGYNRSAGNECEDIDECAGPRSVCHEYSKCYNTIGTFICCPPGFEANGQGTCDYIDHCKSKPCLQIADDQHYCVNYFNARKCIDKIEEGYEKSSIGLLELIDKEDKSKPRFLQISHEEITLQNKIGKFEDFKLMKVKLPEKYKCNWILEVNKEIDDSADLIHSKQLSHKETDNEIRVFLSASVIPQTLFVSLTCEINSNPYYRNLVYFSFKPSFTSVQPDEPL